MFIMYVSCKVQNVTEDHSLLRGRFKLCVHKTIRKPVEKILKRLDVNKLKQKDVCVNLAERLDCLDCLGDL